VIITLGEKGAFFKNDKEEYFVDAYKMIDKVVILLVQGMFLMVLLLLLLQTIDQLKNL
jgi:hypothetical protein